MLLLIMTSMIHLTFMIEYFVDGVMRGLVDVSYGNIIVFLLLWDIFTTISYLSAEGLVYLLWGSHS